MLMRQWISDAIYTGDQVFSVQHKNSFTYQGKHTCLNSNIKYRYPAVFSTVVNPIPI